MCVNIISTFIKTWLAILPDLPARSYSPATVIANFVPGGGGGGLGPVDNVGYCSHLIGWLASFVKIKQEPNLVSSNTIA